MKAGDVVLTVGVLGVAGAGVVYWRARLAGINPPAIPSAPGPTGLTGASATGAAAPMTVATLLQYPVGQIPVPDAVAWVPAQNAARVMQDQGQGQGLFNLAHHPVGYYGPSEDNAQRAAAYLWDLGVDPCPPALYADLQAASQATGVPLPLLLAVAFTESTFLRDGTAANAGVVSSAGDVGLMQVGPQAAQQVGLSWAAVQQSSATNALAGAKYLAYLAGLHHVPVGSTDYALWAPVLSAYGEGAAAAATIANAGTAVFVAQSTPAAAVVTQQATNRAAAPTAYQTPAAVTCTTAVAHLSVAGAVKTVTSRVCSNGTRQVQSIT